MNIRDIKASNVMITGKFCVKIEIQQPCDAGTRGDGLEAAERLDIAIDVAHAITYLHTYTGKLVRCEWQDSYP